MLRLARLKRTVAVSAKSRLTLPTAAEVAAGELTQQLRSYCCSTVPIEKTE
jgi:BarA-like signal transduction histidine kinase